MPYHRSPIASKYFMFDVHNYFDILQFCTIGTNVSRILDQGNRKISFKS